MNTSLVPIVQMSKPGSFRRPTTKQIRLAQALKGQIMRGEELNISKAGKEAGYASRQHTHKAVQGGTFRALLSALTKRVAAYEAQHDLTSLSAKCLAEGLKAVTVGKGGIEHPDHDTRLKFNKLYLTLLFATEGIRMKKSAWV